VDRESANDTALSLQVSSSQAVVVVVEGHHLESFEPFRDFIDLLLLTLLDDFHAWCIPFDVFRHLAVVGTVRILMKLGSESGFYFSKMADCRQAYFA